MTTKKAKAPADPDLYAIKDGTKVDPPTTLTPEQGRTLGTLVAQAVREGREFEVRPIETGAVLLLTSAADDLGHVYLVDVHGIVRDVGHTEKG